MHKTIQIAILLLISWPQCALATVYRCPEAIETKQSLATEFEKAGLWSASFDTTARGLQNFESISLFDGPPNEMAALVPDNDEDEKARPYWTFALKKERSIWLECNYRQTAVHLSISLPKTVTRCINTTDDSLSCR